MGEETMKLIGISGKKKSGKSLIADLISLYYTDVYVYNFADELKKEVSIATQHSVEYINEHKDSFRLILQGWGTDFRRKKDENYWVKKWMEGVNVISNSHPASVIVAADVRFLNEVSAIKQLGGQIWRVERDGNFSNDIHLSEVELDNYPFEQRITNNGTKEDLARLVRELLKVK